MERMERMEKTVEVKKHEKMKKFGEKRERTMIKWKNRR